jgi:hypothetical protein
MSEVTPASDPLLIRTPAVAAPPPPPPRLPTGRRLWALVGAGLAVLALGVWLVSALLPDLLTRPDTTAAADAAVAPATAETRRIQAALFYVAEDGMTLTPVSREVVYGATPAEQARRILEAQVAPPPEGRVSAIPAGTTVRAAYLTATGEAYVDLGGAIVSGHSGGSLDEALTVYAILNALAANLPGVTTVQILVEGQEVDSLVGHLDLRHPLGRALDWVRKDPAS